MSVSCLLCCLQLHKPHVAYGVASAVIYHKYIYSRLYRGGSRQSSAHLLHPPILLGFTAPVHPLISHHFTQLSASASLFLLIAHNNPPKSLSRSAFFPTLGAEKTQWQPSEKYGQAEEISRSDEYTHICGRFPLQINWTLTVLQGFFFLPHIFPAAASQICIWKATFGLFCLRNEMMLNLMHINKETKSILTSKVSFESSCGNCVEGVDTQPHNLRLVITLIEEVKLRVAPLQSSSKQMLTIHLNVN